MKVQIQHWWTNPNDGATYKPLDVVEVSTDLARMLVADGLATYPAEPDPAPPAAEDPPPEPKEAARGRKPASTDG